MIPLRYLRYLLFVFPAAGIGLGDLGRLLEVNLSGESRNAGAEENETNPDFLQKETEETEFACGCPLLPPLSPVRLLSDGDRGNEWNCIVLNGRMPGAEHYED